MNIPKLEFENKNDCIGHNTLIAIAKDEMLYLLRIQNDLLKDGILYRSYYHVQDKINTMSRDHVLRLKISCRYFGAKLFDEYFESLKLFKRISDKKKSRLTLDLWLFINDYHFLWQLFARVWYAGILFHWNMLLRKIFSIKVKNWYEHDPDEYDNKFQEWVCRKQKEEKKQVFLPGFVQNQLSWMIYVSKDYGILTRSIKKRFLQLTWPGNPHAELLLTGQTEFYNIEFIKHTGLIDQKMPCQYSDAKFEYKDEINYRYFLCLRLYQKNNRYLPKELFDELKKYSNV